MVNVLNHFASAALISPTPAMTAANAAAKSGDIVVFTFSHIGIAVSSPDDDGNIATVEGNTDSAGSREGGGVYLKSRHLSKIRSRIRFTI